MSLLFNLDSSIVLYLNTLVLATPALTVVTRIIGIGAIFIIVLFGVVSLFYTLPGLKVSGTFIFLQMLLSGGAAWVLNNLIGIVWFRERPFVQFPERITPLIDIQLIFKSFPSDHAALAMALAVTTTLWAPKIGVPFIVLALLIGLARVAAGVHFPLDVLFGYVMGVCIALIVHKIFI